MILQKRLAYTRANSAIVITVLISVLFLIVLHYSSSMNSNSINTIKIQLHRNTNHNQSSFPRILCLILTVPKYLVTRAKAVNTTWAPRCDRYFFVTESTENNATAEVLNITKHLPIAPIKNITPGYPHLTQKSNLAFLFAYENYINDFDWFLKADDDTYLIVDHLKAFLSKQNTSEPVTFGYNLKTIVRKGYHPGGAAYVLSRESLRRFHEAYQAPNTTCVKDGGSEDVEIAACLRNRDVYPGKSLDKYNREMFHPLRFINHFNTKTEWLESDAENPPQTHYNCCSDQSISFHYVNPDEQYLMDFLLYRTRSPLNLE